ncbi:MAG TPA: phosphatidylglycerophosphatase A [Phycisphaerae bacterium]|nr:phosphatidylglycerophosphatase A [Phycisphaerae bacterium]HRR87155.1 phosphatidylglycerophosphatase A [Phycisphaerae bacterium]
MMRKWAVTGLGLGFAPLAPGTFGSAGAILAGTAAWTICHKSATDPAVLNVIWVLLTLLAGIGCVAWGPWAIDYFAARSRKPGDPGPVVIDEFAGQWISLVALPMGSLRQALTVLAVQFFLFRLFDVIKPPPARRLERLPAGWGILLDDLAAGIYANIVGQVIFRYFSLWS